MKGLLKTLLLLFVVLVGILFTLQNPAAVAVDFHYFHFNAPLSLVILFSVLIGVILGWMLVWIRMLPRLRRYRQLEKKCAEAEAEIINLRRLPITDEP